MLIFLWLLLLIFCWPLALLILVLYPLVWLILLPFRIAGFAVEGVLALLRSLLLLPARLLSGGSAGLRDPRMFRDPRSRGP
jgi:hypothetical protein